MNITGAFRMAVQVVRTGNEETWSFSNPEGAFSWGGDFEGNYSRINDGSWTWVTGKVMRGTRLEFNPAREGEWTGVTSKNIENIKKYSIIKLRTRT